MGMIADVFTGLIIDSDDNVVAYTTLTGADINISLTANDVRAGAGNPLIAIIHAQRDIEVTLTDVTWKFENLAMHLGQNITTVGAEEDAYLAYHMPIWLEAEESGMDVIITLPEEVAEDSEGDPVLLKVYDESGDLIESTNLSATGAVVAITGGVEGAMYEVRTFVYETDEATEQLVIDEQNWPKDFKLVLETLEIDYSEQPTHKLQYIFDRSKPGGDMTISTASERNATTQEMNMRILKPKNSTQIGRALRIPLVAEEEGEGEGE